MDQVADKSHRVAISLEMEWGFKRHVEMYAGCQRYADEVGWESFINPSVEAAFKTKEPWPYDGVLARVTQPMGDLLLEKGVPVVNVWMNSPVKGLPSVYPDFEATGIMAAEHILSRGFKQFGYLGYVRDIDSRLQYKGFEGVANREGFPCSDFRVSRTSLEGRAPGWDEFISRLEKWVDTWEPPIGVFVTSDTYCRYLIDVCRSKGLHVSQEVAISAKKQTNSLVDEWI